MPDQIGAVIRDVKKSFVADGNGIKEPVPSELSDRLWRADLTADERDSCRMEVIQLRRAGLT